MRENASYSQEYRLLGQLQKMGAGGNVDLTNRPQVSSADMKKAGYDIGDGYATTYTSTFSNADGSRAGNFTPIRVQNGQLHSILNANELQQYAESVMDGSRTDDLGLQIGGYYEGADAIQKASSDAEKQHRLQEMYYEILRRRLSELNGDLR